MTNIRNLSSSLHSGTNPAEKSLATPASPLLSPAQLQTLQALAVQLSQSPTAAVPQAGNIALFTGPDNAAKAAAAQTLANNLHRDLDRIDLSVLVSKYAGDSVNALRQLLHSSAPSNAILFFDEADALFGKRTNVQDSHDRYANQSAGQPDDGTGVLQLLQQYPGILILAVNSTDGWNPALLVRMHTTLKFPPTP